MNQSRHTFSQLLTEGLYAIKVQEAKTLEVIQDELGFAIGRESGGSAIAHWRRGYVPASHIDLENLARAMVKRGSLARTWVEQLFAQTEYASEGICAELFSESNALPNPPRSVLSLPGKDYKQLIGRETFIKEIITVLASADGPSIVSIDGQGGIGKTAMALDVTDLCQRKGLFDEFIWLSAARQPGIHTQTESQFTLEMILDSLGSQVEGEDFAYIPLTEKKRLVQSYLTAHRVLIVLDNLETAVQPQAELTEQLRPLLSQSKAILTSRHRFRQNTYPIHLVGLENEGAAHFIQHYSLSKGIHHIQDAATEEIKEIIWTTGGSPLAIQLVVSQLHHLPLPVVLKSLREVTPLSQIADEGEYVKFYKFVFHYSWALLNNESKSLLVTMSQFVTTNGAQFEAIQHVSELEFGTLVSCIETLWDSSLLEVRPLSGIGQIRYYLHPLTQNFVLSDIANVL